jgi:hypothetical protein
MRVIQGPGPVIVSVVCCPHGNELIGQYVFEYYEPIIAHIPGLRLVFANEPAHNNSRRFIDADLNRCFPGSPTGNHEERLAHTLMPLITDARFVLDLHTTTSDIVMTPIVANLGADTRAILNLTPSHEIAFMQAPIPERALIGQVTAGVSLEYNHEYAKRSDVLQDLVTLIQRLLVGSAAQPQPRQVFAIDSTIPLDPPLPVDTPNFAHLPELGVYPFLLREKAYTTFQAFSAHTANTIVI